MLALVCAVAFWWPARAVARGYFPAPLDDVYIHFDFARSLAHGQPFEWMPGNGYSSGETAPLYAFVLAIGWWLGFHGRALGLFAALIAVVSVGSFVRSVQRLAAPRSRVLAALLAVLVLSVGVLDWTLFSGMEMALFAAVLGLALEALARTRAPTGARGGLTREAAQWRLGLWGVPLVLLRPEAGVLVALFAVSAARGAGARSGSVALVRAALPGALATALVLGLNRAFTGETQSAGALLKLVSSNPYLSADGRARVFVENLVVFALKGLRAELGALPLVWLVLPVLGFAGLGSRSRRPIAAVSLLGALAWVLVVSVNGNAPHHNFRYYAPAFLLLLVAAALGAATLEGRREVVASVLTAAAIAALGSRVPFQSRFFTRATENIRDQQIELALRLGARVGPGERVLVGDAGAIPYVSERPAIDAMGLGGYRGLPFARAAASGEASIVELIEHLPIEERPTYLALYPNWFATLTARFGTELERVTLTDNVICAGPVKVLYRADWSALEVPGPRDASLVDELDVADILSERPHAYLSPAPDGGWAALDVLDDEHGHKRFDGGRIIPLGQQESFVVASGVASRPVEIVVRVDAAARALRLRAPSGVVDLELDEAVHGTWRHAHGNVTVQSGDVLVLEATAPYVDYHVWLRAR